MCACAWQVFTLNFTNTETSVRGPALSGESDSFSLYQCHPGWQNLPKVISYRHLIHKSSKQKHINQTNLPQFLWTSWHFCHPVFFSSSKPDTMTMPYDILHLFIQIHEWIKHEKTSNTRSMFYLLAILFATGTILDNSDGKRHQNVSQNQSREQNKTRRTQDRGKESEKYVAAANRILLGVNVRSYIPCFSISTGTGDLHWQQQWFLPTIGNIKDLVN